MSKAEGPDSTGVEDSCVTPLTSPDPDAIALFRALARSGDTLFLSEGPPHPDRRLLELVDAALDSHGREEAETKAHAAAFRDASLTLKRRQAVAFPAIERARAHHSETTRLAKAAAKLPATTPAGLFGKCQLVRLLLTTKEGIAGSLAADIMGNPDLRALLWPAGGGASA